MNTRKIETIARRLVDSGPDHRCAAAERLICGESRGVSDLESIIEAVLRIGESHQWIPIGPAEDLPPGDHYQESEYVLVLCSDQRINEASYNHTSCAWHRRCAMEEELFPEYWRHKPSLPYEKATKPPIDDRALLRRVLRALPGMVTYGRSGIMWAVVSGATCWMT